VVPSHEIFQEPLKVDLRLEDRAVPSSYRPYPGGDKLGRTTKVWKVQSKRYPEVDFGLVSDPYGFGDSPDAEVIAAGFEAKGPDSVALGRHGNFFLWGFAASPTDMTPEARKCFINAVCYIKKYDGQKPFVRKSHSSREWALVYAGYAKQHGADYIEQAFPEDLRRRLGNDPEKYIAWTKENLEYLRHEGEGFNPKAVVDEEVKFLGLSNRKVELLDRCVAMLERGERPDLASRILKRYTTEGCTEAKQWRSWLETHRGRLFFTDVGGFKFLVAPDSPTRSEGRSPEDPPKEPTAKRPAVVEAELTPAKIRAGETVELVVRVQTAPTWHIYAAEGSNGPGVPTTLTLRLPEGIEAEGQWSYPKPMRGSDGQMIYEGTLEFRRKLRVGAAVTLGRVEVACELGYQACDPHSCRPPTKFELVARADVVGASPRR
jgi:hypothetical protein